MKSESCSWSLRSREFEMSPLCFKVGSGGYFLTNEPCDTPFSLWSSPECIFMLRKWGRILTDFKTTLKKRIYSSSIRHFSILYEGLMLIEWKQKCWASQATYLRQKYFFIKKLSLHSCQIIVNSEHVNVLPTLVKLSTLTLLPAESLSIFMSSHKDSAGSRVSMDNLKTNLSSILTAWYYYWILIKHIYSTTNHVFEVIWEFSVFIITIHWHWYRYLYSSK